MDKRQEEQRIEDALFSTCLLTLHCSVEDLTPEQREALVSMYLFGARARGYIDPSVSKQYI